MPSTGVADAEDRGLALRRRPGRHALRPAERITLTGFSRESDPGAPKCEAAVFSVRHAGARHLLRHAADGGHAGRHGWRRRRTRVRSRHGQALARRAALCRRPSEVRVWASHGDFVSAAPAAGFSVVATSANGAVAGDGRSVALAYACCSILKSSTPNTAWRSSAISPTASAADRRLDDGVVCGRERPRRFGRRSATASRLRAERRRGFRRWPTDSSRASATS